MIEFTDHEIERIRADTPACQTSLHFDNAGAALTPTAVSEAVHQYLRREERYGGYRAQQMAHDALEAFYPAVGRLLNCQPGEVAFMENATRAWDMVFYAFNFAPGDRILTSIPDYGSNVIAYLQQARRLGVEPVFVRSDEDGQIDLDHLRELIDERVRLISLSHIPTGSGLIQPAAEVGRIAREHGIPYLLDACQSVGQLPLDVEAIGCDMLSGTGRKYLRGPRATGLLYVRQGWIERLEPPILDQWSADLISASEYRMRDDARRFETWEQYCAGKVGLAAAINYACDWGLERIAARTIALAAELRQSLSAIDRVTVMDQGRELCGIVTFAVDGCDPTAIKAALARDDVHVSVSEGPGNLVLFQQRGIDSLIRASVHYYNDSGEIQRYCQLLEQLIKQRLA
ncbi:MAG: aminotransferase class V-fold PLP-dependent enzyme [Wenzhouxiangellaceae bacterium]